MSQTIRQSDCDVVTLAPIGATAPLISLLGAVWDIYHALIDISESGQISITTVANPVGEALVSTATGLFITVPAVLAYSFLNRGAKAIAQGMDAFTRGLHVRLLNRKDQTMALESMNSGDDAPISDINAIPLMDVMLMLSIAFMITMPVLTHSIPLELPIVSEKAVKEDKQQFKDPLRLSIDASGVYVIGGDPDVKVDLVAVTTGSKETKAKNEDAIVAVAADKAIEYDCVNQALQAARGVGISKISFITGTKAR